MPRRTKLVDTPVDKPLTDYQKRFVIEYVRRHLAPNAGPEALKAIGSKAQKYKTLEVYACQLTSMPNVRAAIDASLARIQAKAEVDAAWVKRQLYLLAQRYERLNTMDVASLYDDKTGALKPIHEWPEEFRQLQVIREMTTDEQFETIYEKGKRKTQLSGYLKKIKLGDFVPAQKQTLELLGKHVHVKAFEDAPASQSNVQVNVMFVEKRPSVVKD